MTTTDEWKLEAQKAREALEECHSLVCSKKELHRKLGSRP